MISNNSNKNFINKTVFHEHSKMNDNPNSTSYIPTSKTPVKMKSTNITNTTIESKSPVSTKNMFTTSPLNLKN